MVERTDEVVDVRTEQCSGVEWLDPRARTYQIVPDATRRIQAVITTFHSGLVEVACPHLQSGPTLTEKGGCAAGSPTGYENTGFKYPRCSYFNDSKIQPSLGLVTIEELGLSSRAHSALVLFGIRNVADLEHVSFLELARMRNCGKFTLVEIYEKMIKLDIAEKIRELRYPLADSSYSPLRLLKIMDKRGISSR